ncbi:hypothetical protein BsWGS_05136 [Bradybaena similaris]
MSSSNVAHVACVDKGLKMKIKRTKGPNRVDTKHEVVKSDPLAKLATTSSGQSVTVTSLSSTSVPVSVVLSTGNSNGGATGSATGMHTAPAASSLTPLSSASSSSILSSTSSTSFTPSSGTMVATNPIVALQKAGVLPEGYSNNNPASCNRSPLKAIPSGTPGLDSKELKSPKMKAAYSKKVKDNKGKPDGLTTVGPTSAVNGPSISITDTRTSIGISNNSQTFNSAPTPFTSQTGVHNSTMTSEPRPGDTVHMKRENPVHDPYEFNAKVEDKIELPPKKLKLEKADCIETAVSPQAQPQQHSSPPLMLHPPTVSKQQQQQHQLQQQQQPQLHQQKQPPQKRSVGVDVRSIGVLTEPDSLGPCEPGTQVGLEGIVWKETDNGLLVVNVTWRGKTYVGTLMDATRYAWAPPRPNGCDSPVSDFETRTPKGRGGKRNCRNSVPTSEKLPEGRRLRKGRRGTVNSSSSNFTAPPSPAKSDVNCSSSNMKRRTKPSDVDGDKAKKSRPCSIVDTGAESPTPDGYIVCPEPNCQKKYKHMNGLRYHRTHAHRKSSVTDDTKDDEDEDEDEEEKSDKKEKTPMSERAERMKLKERQKIKEQQMVSDRDSKDSLEDDIPLKEIVNKTIGQSNVHKMDAVTTSAADDQSNGNDVTDSDAAGLTANTKTEPQAQLAKTDANVQKESASPVATPTSKIKDSAAGDISDSSLTVVPSVSSMSETSNSSVIINATSNSIDLSSLTTALSHTCSASTSVPLTGTAVFSQARHSLSLVTTQTLPLKTSAARQISATTSTAVLGLTVTADKSSNAKAPSSVKSMSSSHPIVPASSPQTSAASSPFSQNVNSVLFSQGQASTLKHIQPKPTILKDHSASIPVLPDLNKEKLRKAKKKKDHAETGSSLATVNSHLKGQASSKDCKKPPLDVISQDEMYRSELLTVMKNSNLSDSFESSNPSSGVSKLAFLSSINSKKQLCSLNSESTVRSGSRLEILPSALSVYSSVDNKNMITDDVHSPAYSDISDANDSNSPFQQDSPKRDSPVEEDGQINGSLHLGQEANSLSQHYGNMFYFGGPSSYLQHAVGSQISSPTLSDGLKKKDDSEEKRPSSKENSYDKKDGGHNVQDSELPQKSVFNYFSHLHGVSPSVSHLQFNLAGYNSATTDSSYATIAQQALDQHKRLQQQHDQVFKSEDGSGKQTPSGTSHVNRNPGSGFESGSKSRMGNDISEGHVNQKWSDADDNQGVNNRRDDGHHILKECGELKSHTGLNRDKMNYHMTKQQQNDIHRAHLYKQQKQTIYDHQHKRKSPPKLTSNSSHLSNHSPEVTSRNYFVITNKPHDLIPLDSIKKECVVSEDSTRLETVNSKQLDTKDSISQLVAKSSLLEPACRPRSPSQSNTPGIPQSSLASSSSSASLISSTVPSSIPSSSSASALPASLVNSLPAAGSFSYAPYYSHFKPVQMDTMYRAISPHIIGYTTGAHGYIHPTQLGYRVPLADTGKKSPESAELQRADGSGQVNNTGYNPVQKLRELQEKNRLSPGVHSPAPNKPGNGDNLHSSSSTNPDPAVEKVKDKQREYSNSPPTQRHVHTHHHTHVMSGFPPLYTPDAYSKLMKF